MSSLVTLLCLFGMVFVPSTLNIIAYPVSKKWCSRISQHIVKVLAPRIFKILACYKHFRFFGYKDNFDKLPEQFLLISNHQSLFDIPCYMNFFKDKELRFVAKAELSRHIPLVSEMLRNQQHCMIPRTASPVTAMRTLEEFGKRVVEKNQIPVLFPEGTRSRDGNVGKFYAAGFRKLCEASRLPVVVCALDGGYRISNLRTIMTNLHNGFYRVKVLKIYPCPETKETQVKILDEGRMLIQNQLDEWHKA